MKNISRYLALAVGLLAIGALLYYFSTIVAYVLVAWVLSMMGQPLMHFFQHRVHIGRWHLGPSMAAALTLVCYFIFITLLILMFVPLIIDQAYNLADLNYFEVVNALEEPIGNFQQWLGRYGIEVEQVSLERQLRDNLREYFDPGQILGYFGSILSTAGGLLISIFSVVLSPSFFCETGVCSSIFWSLWRRPSTKLKCAAPSKTSFT